MANGQFKRMGAFVGTVVTVVAADRIARQRSTDVINSIGKSFSSSLGVAMGYDKSIAEYQKGGSSVVDVNSKQVQHDGKGSVVDVNSKQVQHDGKGSVNIQAAGSINVWQQGYERANELFPLTRIAAEPRRHARRSIYYWALSLFPQVTTPYVVDWPSIAEQLSGVSAVDDMELVGEIIAELWDRNGL